ncbi:MAG: haloacid dehalogenase type II [Planctomycetes bacterium]|nr:haloacid dehalogenase type II [Planctomycetota bacterium]
MIDLRDFEALTFDCYGTIVDWEAGILAALAGPRERFAVELGDEAVLAEFAAAESQLEAEHPGMPYRQILRGVYEELASSWCINATAADTDAFADSVGQWPPFDDSKATLEYLGQHYVLGILSNVDRASFAATREKLGIEFDEVMTAEDIGSYKPDRRNFEFAIARMGERGIEKSKILHVAQSLYHDHVPAKALGLATVFVDRRAGRSGSGAVKAPAVDVTPDLTVPDLATLAAMHREAIA